MAERHYFNRSRKPPPSTYSRSPRKKLKLSRRHRLYRMDSMHQQAHVAQFEEPTFCPSSVVSLLPQYLYQNTLSPLRTREFEDGQEVGDENTENMTRDPLERILAPTCPLSTGNESSCLVSNPNLLITGHARPHTVDPREDWEEEHGRRIRIALADPDGDDELRQRRLQAATTVHHANQQVSVRPAEAVMPQEPSVDRPSLGLHSIMDMDSHIALLEENLPSWLDSAHIGDAIQSTDSVPDQIQIPDSTWVETPAHFLAPWTRWDQGLIDRYGQADFRMLTDDFLAVDDPRRSYDFADFMDQWQGHQSHVKAVTPREDVTSIQDRKHGLDMQGLRWNLSGSSREETFEARRLWRPSKLLGGSISGSKHLPAPSSDFDVEKHYRFRSYHPRHRAQFIHYQLRNVLAAFSRSNIFYATGDKVMRTSLSCPSISTPIMDFSTPESSIAGFRITCISASQRTSFSDYRSENVLLAGGFNGEYAMLDMNSEGSCEHTGGFVTHAYNGLVTHIHTYPERRVGALHAVFCSNDRKLRLMDIKTLRFIECFEYEHAVNYSATSHDGRLRILAGDINDTFVTNAETGEILVTLKGHDDHCFACAWSPDGRLVATAAQDGKTIVSDTRKWTEPLQTLTSVMSCARSLHFTEDGALVVAENDDIVSVYDTRDFTIRQDIRFFGSIAGVVLLDGGSEIAVANTDRTVGGLLSFQRVRQGLNGASYGVRESEYNREGWRRAWPERLSFRMAPCDSNLFV